MKVIENNPCTYGAIQMKVDGGGIWDGGSYHYLKGDWLLHSRKLTFNGTDPSICLRVDDADLILTDRTFKAMYTEVKE